MSSRVGFLKSLDRYAGGTAVRLLGLWNFHRTKGPPFVEIVPARVERVLFIRPGGIGDLLLLLPSIRAVRERFPKARITLVGERRNRVAAELTDLLDEIICYDESPVRFLRSLQSGDFDIAVDSEQFHYSSALFTFLSRAPVRIGFKTSPTRNELYTHLVDYPMDRQESQAFGLLVRPLGVENVEPERTLGLIDRSRLPVEIPGLVACPGEIITVFPYGGAREKAWPAGRWSEIVRRLLAAVECRVVLVGGEDSSDLAEAIRGAVNDRRVIPLVGRLTFAETAAVLARTRLYIGADTGVTHLAQVLGVRSVVLYGPSDERKWGPLAGLGTAVSTYVPCRPCSIFGYYKHCRTIDCMDRISQEQVWSALERELLRI